MARMTRRTGILAAAGLIALEEGPKRLQEDHANARLLAEALATMPGVSIDPEAVETNIVIFGLTGKQSPQELVARLKARNILMSALGHNLIRLVTHLDVDRAMCAAAGEAIAEELDAL